MLPGLQKVPRCGLIKLHFDEAKLLLCSFLILHTAASRPTGGRLTVACSEPLRWDRNKAGDFPAWNMLGMLRVEAGCSARDCTARDLL